MKLNAALLAASVLLVTVSTTTTFADDSSCGPKEGAVCVPAGETFPVRWVPAHSGFLPGLISPDGGFQPQIPCLDVDGCPDLEVDETHFLPFITQTNFGVNSCAVVEDEVGAAGVRRLLRFEFASPNMGEGDLIVGAPRDHPEWFEFPTCHGHFHFKQYADYRLWTLVGYLQWTILRLQDPNALPEDIINGHPELQLQLLRGDKRGFCVIDILPYGVGAAHYQSCNNNQGISVNWADVYSPFLSGQWVDITGIVPGIYVLEAEVNAERLYAESDYANNAAAVIVQIPPG